MLLLLLVVTSGGACLEGNQLETRLRGTCARLLPVMVVVAMVVVAQDAKQEAAENKKSRGEAPAAQDFLARGRPEAWGSQNQFDLA